MKKWERLSSETKFKNPWWTYRLDRFRLPSGTEGEYHIMDVGGSSMIVPVLADGRILLVEQYRYLMDDIYLELPAGGIQEGEDPEAVAHKELIEETGHDGDLEYVGKFVPLNGLATEVTHVYIARNLRESDLHQPDETEEFTLRRMTPEEIDQKIAANEMQDGMSIAAWALARGRIVQ